MMVPQTAPDRAPGSVSRTFDFPWLQFALEVDALETSAQVERAFTKLASGGSLQPLTLRGAIRQTEPAAEAASVWANGRLRYQFVVGDAGEREASFATADGSLLRVDLAEGILEGWLRPETFTAPYSTWADLMLAPLTEFWRAHDRFPLHAGAVEIGEHRLLIPGYSGSGKTTLSLAMLAAGGCWRADDKLLFHATPEAVWAVSLYRNTNLHPGTVEHHPALQFTLARESIDETNPKRPCLLEELPVAVDLGEFAPTALLFPRVAHTAVTTITRLPRPQAHLRLAAQSPLSVHSPRIARQVRAVAELVKRLPAFALDLGRDVLETPAAAVERVVAALEAGR